MRTNLPDFRRQLREVGERVQRRYVRRSMTAAGAVLRGLAREKAPVLTRNKRGRLPKGRIPGLLRRAIYVTRNRRKSSRGVEVYSVGVKSKVRVGKGVTGDPFYWRWQEAGWLPRGPGQRIRGGTRTRALTRSRLEKAGVKRVPGRWFLRDAARQGQSAAVDAFFRRMDESFAQENRR